VRYSVIIGFDCNASVEVVASTPEEARDKAHGELSPSLCHECSREVNLGEPVYAIVEDESGEVVLDESDDYDRGRKEALDEVVALLEAEKREPGNGADDALDLLTGDLTTKVMNVLLAKVRAMRER
jgi:hypothetical protein